MSPRHPDCMLVSGVNRYHLGALETRLGSVKEETHEES